MFLRLFGFTVLIAFVCLLSVVGVELDFGGGAFISPGFGCFDDGSVMIGFW
uniref:Uncharacterized protein n=1 Tax=Rhizophora mucronata TaxID=61149 RepID=A0A2P2L877_RHIMU